MEIENSGIVLKYEGSSLIDSFSLKRGEAIFIFAPLPKEGKVQFISCNKEWFYCPQEPCWVKCVAYNIPRKDLKIVNRNIDIFQKWGIFYNKKGTISQRDIDKLDGGDVRLMNILINRLKDKTFLEVTTMGLAFDSIERVLNLIVYDISHNKVAYVIINNTDTVIPNTNPIYLRDKHDIETIMHDLNRIWELNRVMYNSSHTSYKKEKSFSSRNIVEQKITIYWRQIINIIRKICKFKKGKIFKSH